jgi:hypothetical protein
MKFALKILYALLLALVALSAVLGQQPIAPNTEFITSSSPLSDGSIVTTTYYPRLGVAPETRLAAGYGPVVGSPFVDSSKPSIEQSVLQGNAGQVSLPASQLPLVSPSQLPSALAPVETTPMYPIVQVPTWGNPFAGPRRYLPSNYQPAPSNLGIPQVSVGYLPTGTVYPYPVASTVPTFNTAPVLPPTINSPAALPPTGYTDPNRGNYQPLLRFQNLPPGSHLGWHDWPTHGVRRWSAVSNLRGISSVAARC